MVAYILAGNLTQRLGLSVHKGDEVIWVATNEYDVIPGTGLETYMISENVYGKFIDFT